MGKLTRLSLKPRVPVSVAEPSLKRLRGADDATPLEMSAKPYKIVKKEKEQEKKMGSSGGAAVKVDLREHPTDAFSASLMAKLRKQWLEKTLPKMHTDVPDTRQSLGDETKRLYEILTKATKGNFKISGHRAYYARMGVRGRKWEHFVWGPDGKPLGLGYGTFTTALFLALSSSVAALVKKVSEQDQEEEKEEAGEGEEGEEEGEESVEGEEGVEGEEDEEGEEMEVEEGEEDEDDDEGEE
eukprot:Sspe_Gene.86514::Locus_57189_Transcript_1_1_Confidence_1.000_Length_840::g.86514::m.86514